MFNHQTEDLVDRAKALIDGRGVNLVLDMVGGIPLFDAYAFRGRYGLIGASGGDFAIFGFAELLPQSLTVFSFIFDK